MNIFKKYNFLIPTFSFGGDSGMRGENCHYHRKKSDGYI
jgi:hypothetical protein